MKTNTLLISAALALAVFPATAQSQRVTEDEPAEYRDRQDMREAYRRGYERGYDRGYAKGMDAARGNNMSPPPPPPPVYAPPPVVLGPIKVTSAFYGTTSKNCDATRWVGRHANGKRSYTFKVSNDMCGDPAHGDRKSLEVTYWCGQVSRTASAREHQSLLLDCN
jgi:hypothetical protein